MNMENKNLLEIKDLFIQYETFDGIVRAVNGVSLTLAAGETLGLVGETGAGKTTIAKSILRLLPTPPARITGGEIRFNGENLFERSEKEMRKLRGNRISMIFQDPMSALNPVLTVGDQIMESIVLHQKCNRGAGMECAKNMLEMVGIPQERFFDYPHQFSGGMKQRVVIAIALACDPILLLADEPTTALDVTIQAQVLELIHDLKKKLNTAMIMITHDLGVIAKSCERAAVMYAGSIVELGSREQIFSNPLHPYTKGLFGSLPSLSKNECRLKPIPGLMPDPIRLPDGCAFAPRCTLATPACSEGPLEEIEPESGHFVRCHRCKKEDERL